MQLVLLAFEMVEETADAAEAGVPIDDHVLLLGIEFRPGDVQRNGGLLGKALEFSKERLVLRLGPRLNRAFVQRLRRVGNHQIEVEIDRIAEALATRARAIRIVEREEPWLRFFVAYTAMLAFETVGKTDLLRWLIFTRSRFKDHFTGFPVTAFDGIDDPGARIRRDCEAIGQ